MPGPGQILVKVNWTGLCASVCNREKRTSLVWLTSLGQIIDPR